MADSAKGLYEEDYHAWALAQADALRRLAASRWNGPLDLENLAEEVEGLGKAERNTVLSQLERIIEHLLKLEHSTSRKPRRELERHLTPTLGRLAEAELPRIYGAERRRTARVLRLRREPEAAAALPEACPYTLAQLLDEDWFPANRHGLSEPV